MFQVGLTSLLSKCHLSSLLGQLSTATGRISGAVNGLSEEEGLDLEQLAMCLAHIRTLWQEVEGSLGHPARHLPCSGASLGGVPQLGAPEHGYFCLVKSSGLLEVLGLLLCHPTASDCEPLASSLQSLLRSWLHSEQGLLFLASSEATGGLVRALAGGRGGQEGEHHTTTNSSTIG